MEQTFNEIRQILSLHLSDSQANEAAQEITQLLQKPKADLLKKIEENIDDKSDPELYLREWDTMTGEYEKILEQSRGTDLETVNVAKLEMLKRFRPIILGMSRELKMLYTIKEGLEIVLKGLH